MEQLDSIRESSVQSSRNNQQESTQFIPPTLAQPIQQQNGGTNHMKQQSQCLLQKDRSKFSQLSSQNSGHHDQQKKYSNSQRHLPKHKYSNSKNQIYGSAEQIDTEKGEKVYLAGKHIKIRCKLKGIVKELSTRRFKQLTDKQFITLNDNSIYIQPKQITLTFKQKVSQCLESIDRAFALACCCKTFHPYSRINFANQIIESFMIIFCLFYYSLFCFYDYFAPDLFVYLGTSSLVIFSMGTFLRMNTGYFDQGQIIYDRAKIFKQYREGVMFYDLIGFIGQIYQLYTNNNNQLTKILCFLLIFKYKVYLQNIDKIEDRLNFTGNMVYLWQLVRLMCTSLAMCHFVGVAYYFVAFCESYYLEEPNTWVDKLNLWDKGPAHKYIESYYWALATMTLIGTKGDTLIETIFCIVVLINTIGIFATILSRVAMVHDEMEKKSLVYKKDRDVLTSFFELHNTPRYLQGQLHNYLKYSFQGHKEKKANQDFQILMNQFPDALQDVVQAERYSEKIKKFSLLTKTFTGRTVKQLINYIKEEYFMPGQVIIKKGVYEEPKIYLILTGEAEVYSETDGKRDSVLNNLSEGQFFGENTFFTNGVPFYSVKSKEDSFMTCISIKRSDFLAIISQSGSEQDKEKFYAIKDQIKFQKYSYSLQTECYICGKPQHFEENCNMLFYKPNKIYLSARFNHSVKQERSSHTRSDQRSGSALFDHLIIFDRTNQILEQSDLLPFVLQIQTHQQMLEDQLTVYSDSSGEEDYDVYDIHNSVDSPQLKPNQFSGLQQMSTRQGTAINLIQNNDSTTILSQMNSNNNQPNSGALQPPNSAVSPRNQINNIKISEVSNESQKNERLATMKNQFTGQFTNKTIEFDKEIDNSGVSRLDETHDFHEIDEYSKGDAIKVNQKDLEQKSQQKWLFMEKYSAAKSQKIHQSIDVLNSSRMNASVNRQKTNGLGFGLNGNVAFRRKSNLFSMHSSKQNLLHQQIQRQQYLTQQSNQERKSRKQSTFLSPLYAMNGRRGTNNQSALLKGLQRKSFIYQQCMNNVHDPFQQMIIQQLIDISTQVNDFYSAYQAKLNGENNYVAEGLSKEEFFMETDKMWLFQMYFIHNNYDQVIFSMDPNKKKKIQNQNKKSKQNNIVPNYVKNQLKQSQASLSRSKYEV